MTRTFSTRSLLLFAPLLLLACAAGTRLATAQRASDGSEAAPAPVADAPLAESRRELLALAFDAASKLPLQPHIKNRARAQEQVVQACLDLDQPRTALAFAGKIPNWRRGAGFAGYALWCARHGAADEARHYLELAGKVADEEAGDEMSQDWRPANIRAGIAETLLVLGERDEVAAIEASLPDSEAGRLRSAQARELDEQDVDGLLDALGDVVQRGTFEQVRNALTGCAQLFDRFYANAPVRERVEGRIKACWVKMPVLLRVELTLELARFALDHGDTAKARTLTDEADALRTGSTWTPEMELPLIGEIAGVRQATGDESGARAELAAGLELFKQKRDAIVDVYRAGALRPLAEAFHALGDQAAAGEVYARAAEEGVHNPNSRPRTEDLVATCLSMARVGFEPDAKLLARLHEIGAALSAPW